MARVGKGRKALRAGGSRPPRGGLPPVVDRRAFRSIHKTRVSESIIEQVRDLIASGRLSPGDRLPSERDLAERFSVGRSAVREAIRAMESLGLIQARAGEGTFVALPPDSSTGQDAVSASLLQEWSTQRKLFEVRCVIEPDLAALAARRATKEQIERLRTILDEQEAEIRHGGTSIKQDAGFHYTLAEATGNEVLVRIVDSLMDLLLKTRQESLQNAERRLKSLGQHRAVLRAIEARDPQAAERQMLEHIRGIEELVFSKTQPFPAESQGSPPSSSPEVPE
jgi:GntR family transcriptional repressor for pyruvate dehydrogenase complex